MNAFNITANSKTSNIRANFENLAKDKEQEDRKKAEAEKAQRLAQEKQEQEEARRKEVSKMQFFSFSPPTSKSNPLVQVQLVACW